MRFSPPVSANWNGKIVTGPAQSHKPRGTPTHIKEHAFKGSVHRPVATRRHGGKSVKTLVSEWFGANAVEFGRGTYGIVYKVNPSATSKKQLEELHRHVLHNLIQGSLDKTFGTKPLIVKTLKQEPGTNFTEFLDAAIRETKAHIMAQKGAHAYVPKIHFAGTTSSGYFITVMEYVQGVPLAKVTITPALYKKLHAAVVSLWSLGIVHADLHNENVMITPQGDVKIIDFGFAVMLPPDQQKAIAPFLRKGDVDGAWEIIQPYVDAVQLSRIPDLSWYNPNAKALQVWKQSSENGRSVLGGFSGASSTQTASSSRSSSRHSSRHHSSGTKTKESLTKLRVHTGRSRRGKLVSKNNIVHALRSRTVLKDS